MTAVTVATIAGNAAVIAAIRRATRLPAHYPLASLALADLLVGVFVLPIGAARELFVFSLNWAICSAWSTMDVLCCTASILSLCVLGWERWCGITAPLARARRSRRARLYAGLVWPIATAVALPTAFIPSPKNFLPGEEVKACTVNTNVGYVFFSTFFSFYLPATVMLIFYARILSSLRTSPAIRAHRGRVSSDRNVGPPQTNQGHLTVSQCVATPPSNVMQMVQNTALHLSPNGCHLKPPAAVAKTSLKTSGSPGDIIPRQRRATRTIVMLMSLFLVCWTPFFVMLPIDSLCGCVWDVTWQWCTWLGYLNSALNPLVYAAASPSVRRALHAQLNSSSTRTDMQLSSSSRRA